MVMVPTTPTNGDGHGDGHGDSYCCSGESSRSSDAMTNWQIAHGSLESAVSFESSDSPIEPDSTPKSPLILKPPSLDSGPCEIKILFAQRHEIQQVYVRSSARVYEIYYASSLHGENEYLCTVRCSMAEREGEILLAGIDDASNQHAKVIEGGSDVEKFTGKGKTGSNSDGDWVDVEVHDYPNGINCSVKQAAAEGGGIIQELYEATAQISDAGPCASLTIRLLSLQSKDCLYIDEVYIFGDPFVSTDSENHSSLAESSAQSSLMAMLVPTLLQLSKSGASRTKENCSSDRQRKDDEVGPTARTADISDAMNGIHSEQRLTVDEEHMSLHVDNQLASREVQSRLPATDLNRKEEVVVNGQKSHPPNELTADVKNNAPDLERVLGQLVDRVNRIEDICLRFEENMLKPINSMEARLQRVEEQLEILAKNSQYTGLPSCNRISAPSFSCTDSNYSSFYNDGNDPPNLASELKKDFPDDKLSTPIDNSSISVNSPHMLPSLVIAAPEFSCGEEEEDNHVLQPLENSPEVKRSQALSIDDALAAALSGFLSSSVISPSERKNFEVNASECSSDIHKNGGDSLECAPSGPVSRNVCITDEKIEVVPSKYNRTLVVTAPEFTLEDLDYAYSAPPVSGYACCCSENRNDYTPSSSAQMKSIENSAIVPDAGEKLSDDYSKVSEVVDFNDQTCAREHNETSAGTSVGCASDEANNSANPKTASKHPLNILFSENKPETGGSAGELDEHDDTQGSCKDILGGCQYSAPSVDFEIPILEVNFGLHEDSGTKLPLEVLLGDTAGICASAEENDAETSVPIMVDDVGTDSLTNSDGLVEDRPSDPHLNQGVFVSLL